MLQICASGIGMCGHFALHLEPAGLVWQTIVYSSWDHLHGLRPHATGL